MESVEDVHEEGERRRRRRRKRIGRRYLKRDRRHRLCSLSTDCLLFVVVSLLSHLLPFLFPSCASCTPYLYHPDIGGDWGPGLHSGCSVVYTIVAIDPHVLCYSVHGSVLLGEPKQVVKK